MSAADVITGVALAVIAVGAVTVAWSAYRLLVVWAEDRRREKEYADQWRRLHAARRQAGE